MHWLKWLQSVWDYANGTAEYQRYLVHWQQNHAQQGGMPMSRKAYFAARTQRKWNGIKRCC